MEWMDQALCRQTDPALFVPEGNSSDVYQAHEQAKAICRRCPVIKQCQDYAMELATHAQVAQVLEEQISRREGRLLWGVGEELL